MNWSKAKNWIIVLFIGLNIILIVKLVLISINSSTVDKDIIEKTVSVLNSNGINISEERIPNKIPKLNSVEVTNSIYDKDVFAKALLGNNFKKYSDSYSAENKSLQFLQSSFLYTNTAPNDDFSSLTTENATDLASAFLSKVNIFTDSAVSSVTEKDGIYTVKYNQKLDKYPLFDSYITVMLSKEGITSIEGNWFSASNDQSSIKTAATRITPATSALIDFISDPSRIENGSDNIIEISLGYTSGEDSEYHTHAAAIPVWQIKTSDNNYYYFDAR